LTDARPRLTTGASLGQARRAGQASDLGKRLFDLAVASACLLMVFPLLAAVAVLVRLTAPGPAVYRQIRLGRDRRPFVLYKFRTMHDGCGDEVHQRYVRSLAKEKNATPGGRRGLYKLEDDARITPLGRVLRQLSIDELPQLFNVIKGDMSLVGPRPVLPWEAELFHPPYDQRFMVVAGMTGLWQVSGRNRLTFHQGLDLDVEYVHRRCFALDLLILVKTIRVVLFDRSAL
jgi:lipopolysaccharide/colanic/teichoic acid biosynthesis glycosyltransferase